MINENFLLVLTPLLLSVYPLFMPSSPTVSVLSSEFLPCSLPYTTGFKGIIHNTFLLSPLERLVLLILKLYHCNNIPREKKIGWRVHSPVSAVCRDEHPGFVLYCVHIQNLLCYFMAKKTPGPTFFLTHSLLSNPTVVSLYWQPNATKEHINCVIS